MNRILGIELRRSAALGAALLIAVAGTIVLHATAGRWSTGWMALAMTQREYLAVLSPLAMAAGAWQSYREHRANVAELLATVPRPRPQRMVPILATTALAVLVAYLVTLLAAAPRIADTARYLPPAAFFVVAVGLVAMIASVWLGLAVGRLVPALATAPALAVIGFALLILAPHTLPDGGFTAAFSPAMGMSMFSDYDTVDSQVSAAQALWMAAVAVAGVVLFAVQNRKFAFAALLPLAIGATATALVVPTGDAYDQGTLDPVAQELVCTDDTPRVCVSRAHEGLLPEPGQYTSAAFAQVCDGFGIRRSMGRVGSSYDNALAESFWQGLKGETMHQRMFSTVRQARLEIFQWLSYYNARRRHSALNYLSPAEFEQQQRRARKLTLAA